MANTLLSKDASSMRCGGVHAIGDTADSIRGETTEALATASAEAERDLCRALEVAPADIRHVDVDHDVDDALAVRFREDHVAVADEVPVVSVGDAASRPDAQQ